LVALAWVEESAGGERDKNLGNNDDKFGSVIEKAKHSHVLPKKK